MGTSGSAPDVSREEARGVFARLGDPHAPLSTAEVAERLDCPEGTARQALEALADGGELRSRDLDGRGRVWWRPADGDERSDPDPDRFEFAAFVDAVEDYAIFALDPDGRVASWNEGAVRIKGYAEEEIVGEHFSTFYTDEDVDEGAPERNLERAATEGRVEDEGWRVRADGSEFWADVTITAIRDDDGDLRGFTKVTRDMTERREHERRLRRERDLTEQILETVPVSIFLLDADGEFVRANQRTLDRLDVSEAELEAYDVRTKDLFDADGEPVPPDERPWSLAVENGEPVEGFECQVDLPDLGRRWLSINAAPIEEDRAGDGRVVVSVDDITEQKDREQRLRREYRQTEELLRTAPIAIEVQNTDRETVMANRRAQEAFGLSEQEFMENPVDEGEWEIYDGDGEPLPPDETPSARVLATGEPVFNQEISIEPPDGDRMQFRINAAPLFGPDGEIERVVTAGEEITELKRRERQLERRKSELETELSEILDRVSDAFYAVDDDWRFTHVNERAAELLGHSADELAGRELWEVFPDAEDGVYGEQFRTAMDTQEPVSFEVFPDAVDAWLEFNAYPSESGLSIYFRDVTERVRREQELERYETIVEAVNDGVYVVDEEGRLTMVNDAYAEILGYDPDELLGKPASQIVDDDVRERAQEIEAGLVDGEVAEPVLEAELETATGDRVPVEATFALLPAVDGKTRRVGVVRDVSERKARERELEESERRYRTLVENFPEGAVGLFDENLEYTAVGGQLLDEVGVAMTDRVGSSVSDLYPDHLVDEIEPNFRAALDGESNAFEVQFHDRHLYAHTLPVRNADEEVFAGMLVVQDVTERREYQRQLEESNERLEQFAYAASHDLQEPLRMVSSYLQLLERRYADDLDEDGEEFIEYAVDGADRMRDMIEGLLQYSRVDTRGDPFEPVDLDDVLADVRENLQVKIEESDAEITAESLPEVEGDAGQLRQVLQNLLDNAIEYSGDDPPRVHVSAERDGNRWQIAISDEGIGIDPDDADQVFEVFQSLHATDEYDGTGIGLALCERIVERHGGDIWIDSEAGEGATFSFTLPTKGT